MRMSNSPSHRLLDQQRLLAQSHYRNSISPSSTYNSEDEDHHSDNSKSGILSNAQQAVVNSLLGNTNHNSSNSANITSNNQVNNNQFPFNAMNGSNNQNDLQQAVAQQAANAAAAQLSAQIRKLQQHHNQLNNSNNTNGPNSAALAAAAAQLTNSNASNSFSNYSAFYNAAAAALNGGADLPLLNNLANSLASVKNSVNNSHTLANALNNSNGQANSSSNGSSQQSPYIATNQYTEITYKGQQVAAFYAAAKNPTEYLLCLPQAFELFLKHLVGGLHTVYTKLKRLDIVPIVCNVEQVRILRSRGAIQPGVNRCKLLSTKDFDILYKDCTTARSGRPARPNEDAGLLPNCGDVDLADCEVSCDERQSRRVLARLGNRLPDSLLKRHKNDLDNNMLPLLFANEDSGQGGTESSHRSSPNGQLLSPAAALRFAVRNSPGISSLQAFNGSSNNLQNSGNNSTSNTNNSNQVNSNQNNSSNQSNNNSMLGSADFNATAAYIWLLSQQQQQNNNSNNSSNRNSSSSNGILNGDLLSTPNANHNSSTNGPALSNNALSALNLTRGLTGNGSGNNTNANQNSSTNNSELLNNTNNKINNHQLDESTDEDDDEMDDSELRSSHSNLSNSIDNHQSLFNGFGKENRTDTPNNEQINNILGSGAPALNNKENDSTKADNKELPFGQLGLSNLINNNDELFRSLNRSNNSSDNKNSNQLINSQNINTIANNLISNTDSLESYLRNIGNLISIAAQNARHQQEQLNLHKAELRAELLNVVEKERDFREQLERQLNQEQKFRLIYQKRFKKERRIRKKIEQDLQQVQNQQIKPDRNSPTNEKSTTNGSSSPIIKQQNKINENLDNGNSPYGSPASTNENLKENTNEEKDCEMAVD